MSLDPIAALLTGTPCPPWCDLATAGHPYRFGLDDTDPPAYHRLHHQRLGHFADGQARLDLNQLETTTDPDQPGDLAPAEIILSMAALVDGHLSLPDAPALRDFIASLQAAAARLENDGAWSA